MGSLKYQRITIQFGDQHFSVYCTQESLDRRRDEVILWADKLARTLHWRTYEIRIDTASVVEATVRQHALFEYRFPAEQRAVEARVRATTR